MKLTYCFLITVLAALPTQATILTFNISDPQYSASENLPEGFQIDQTYGDRVTTSSQTQGTATFEYGVGAEGYTPNIVADYGPFSIFTGGPSLWRYDYGDLTRVLYQGSTFTGQGFDYDYLLLTLRADPGFEAVLYSFDLGGWNQTDYTINAVSVYDAGFNGFFPAENRVFYQPNASVQGSGPSRSSFVFNTPIRGAEITILIDSTNLGPQSELIGIDNVRFGQGLAETAPIPEPGSLVLLTGGLTCLALASRRGRAKGSAV
jgi:hypothetical protein